ncbi:MAG: RNA 2',3'-cyclic phosphodiesterase [Acidobacteriota bacterium]
MRLFIGIKLNDEVLDKIGAAIIPLKKEKTPVRWVKRENIHITLKFIGETDRKQTDKIMGLFNEKPVTSPFEIIIKGLGTFGREREVRIVWAGIEDGSKLKELHFEIEQRLEKVGIKKELRDYTPHITIGRNNRFFKSGSFFKALKELEDVPISRLKVNSFQIFSSELFPDGPKYKILKNILL